MHLSTHNPMSSIAMKAALTLSLTLLVGVTSSVADDVRPAATTAAPQPVVYATQPATYAARPGTYYVQNGVTYVVQAPAYAAQPATYAAPTTTYASQYAAPASSSDPYGFTQWLNATRSRYGLPAVGYDPNLSNWASANNNQQNARGIGHYVMGPGPPPELRHGVVRLHRLDVDEFSGASRGPARPHHPVDRPGRLGRLLDFQRQLNVSPSGPGAQSPPARHPLSNPG